MDTPVKSQQQQQQQQQSQQQQVSTPFRRFEDSPVFNYINSLSPIKPEKSVHITQTLHSLSFASIPSVFTSPHVSTQKESRFLIRYPLSDLSKPEFSADGGDENNVCATGVSNVVKLSYCAVDAQENCNISCSLNEANVDPPDECPTIPVKLSQSLQYDCGSPNHNMTPCYGAKVDLKLIIGSTSIFQFVQDGLEERINSDASELESQGIPHSDQIKEEGPDAEWENLITDDAEDLLIFNSCAESEACEEHDTKYGNHDSNYPTTLSSKISEDNIDQSQYTQPDGSLGVCLQNDIQGLSQDHNGVTERNEIDHIPQVLSTCQNKSGVSVPNEKLNDEIKDCVTLDSKVDNQNQRGMRRRCLFSEVVGSHKKNLHNDFKNNSSASMSHSKLALDDRQRAPPKPGAGPSTHVLPSIGLHLNALATTSKDRPVTQDSLASGRHLIGMPCSNSTFPSLTSGRKSSYSSLDIVEVPCSTGNEVQDLQVVQDSLQAPAIGDGDEPNQNSPKKKKRKLESGGESDACKRCNCKKSKCLKLYCECFAAGVYCVEPCACQGCFNKPIHEDTVLATRKQIESRNPLAFAPKVIRSSDACTDIGEEAKTPASARHKRGCNCKKSSCLKKYCECYQGGVGCSISCRCEGCKNAFGIKHGSLSMGNEETEQEEDDACEKDEDKPDGVQQNAHVRKDEKQLSENVLPITPSFQICRPSVKLPFFSSGKPPRSSILSIGSSPWLNTCHTLGKSENIISQPKVEKNFQMALGDETPEILRSDSSPISVVKTASPNRKRVSPPHLVGSSPSRKGGRRLILKSIPSFPSLNNDAANEFSTSYPRSSFNSTRLG